jgi:hypothetical protein
MLCIVARLDLQQCWRWNPSNPVLLSFMVIITMTNGHTWFTMIDQLQS